MRLIAAASTIFILALTFVLSVGGSAVAVADPNDLLIQQGRHIFRYDTFGDEQLWTDVLKMHDVVKTVSPATALAVGLKVDVDALPAGVIDALKAGTVNLNDPAVTTELLRLNSVVGVVGKVNEESWRVSASRVRSATRRWITRSRTVSASGSTAGPTSI
jgi:hypothetical protein